MAPFCFKYPEEGMRIKFTKSTFTASFMFNTGACIYEPLKRTIMHLNKKSTMLLAGMLTASMALQAQNVSYRKTENDPDDYKRTMLYLDLFTADTYLEPCLGSAVKLETMVGSRIMPYVQAKFAWADAATHHVVTGFPENKGGQKKQLVIDMGSAFYLVNKNKTKRNVKIVLSSSHYGNYTHTRYIRIPATVKRLFGVEGGIYINRRGLEFDMKSHPFYKYQSKDGHVTVPIDEVGTSTGNIQPSGESYKPLSMTHVVSIYGGLHYRSITNVEISSGEGIKANRNTLDLYADVMLAPVVPISNVIDNTGTEWKLIPQSGAIRHLGWKAGFTHHNCKRVSFEYNFEFGQKPGPVMGKDFMDNGTYISLGMGLSIGSGKYFHFKGKKEIKA